MPTPWVFMKGQDSPAFKSPRLLDEIRLVLGLKDNHACLDLPEFSAHWVPSSCGF